MVLVLLHDGFEEMEVVIPVDLLRRGGVDVTLCGVTSMTVTGAHGITLTADLPLSDADLARADMVFVPGGLGGVNGILASEEACALLKQACADDKYLAAICAGPTVLSRLGLIDGKRAVCYPGMEDLLPPALSQDGVCTVRDGKVLTAQAAGSAFELGLMMLENLKDAAVAQQVCQSVYYRSINE